MPIPNEMGVSFSAAEKGAITTGIQQAISTIVAKKLVQLTW